MPLKGERMDAAGDKLMQELRDVVEAAEALLGATAEEGGERLQEMRCRGADPRAPFRGRGHRRGGRRRARHPARAQMSGGLLDSMRAVAARLISMGQTRFELFGVELREELARLASALLGGLAVLVFGALGLAFAALAFILALQPEQRVLATALVAAGFVALAALVAWVVVRLARAKARPFDATLTELARDYEAVRP
jgi:uncharacterized membrane protein YqjE